MRIEYMDYLYFAAHSLTKEVNICPWRNSKAAGKKNIFYNIYRYMYTCIYLPSLYSPINKDYV